MRFLFVSISSVFLSGLVNSSRIEETDALTAFASPAGEGLPSTIKVLKKKAKKAVTDEGSEKPVKKSSKKTGDAENEGKPKKKKVKQVDGEEPKKASKKKSLKLKVVKDASLDDPEYYGEAPVYVSLAVSAFIGNSPTGAAESTVLSGAHQVGDIIVGLGSADASDFLALTRTQPTLFAPAVVRVLARLVAEFGEEVVVRGIVLAQKSEGSKSLVFEDFLDTLSNSVSNPPVVSREPFSMSRTLLLGGGLIAATGVVAAGTELAFPGSLATLRNVLSI